MKKIFYSVFILIISFTAIRAEAHQPIVVRTVSDQELGKELILSNAIQITDPGITSVAIYDALIRPNQIELYSFVSASDTTVPVEALVPVRVSNTNFRPWVAIIGTTMMGNRIVATSSLPFTLPRGYSAEIIPPLFGEREVFFEPFSVEKLYHNREETITLKKDAKYFFAVFNPNGITGDFALGVGTAENFSGVSKVQLIKNVTALKLGLVGGKNIPVFNFFVILLAVFAVAISAGVAKLLFAMILLGFIRPWWSALALRTQAFFSFVILSGVLVSVNAASMLYRAVGFSSLAPVTILCSAFSIISAVYLFILAQQYRWLAVRVGTVYEKTPSALQWWRTKTMFFLAILVISILGSLASMMWYALIVA